MLESRNLKSESFVVLLKLDFFLLFSSWGFFSRHIRNVFFFFFNCTVASIRKVKSPHTQPPLSLSYEYSQSDGKQRGKKRQTEGWTERKRAKRREGEERREYVKACGPWWGNTTDEIQAAVTRDIECVYEEANISFTWLKGDPMHKSLMKILSKTKQLRKCPDWNAERQKKNMNAKTQKKLNERTSLNSVAAVTATGEAWSPEHYVHIQQNCSVKCVEGNTFSPRWSLFLTRPK